MNETTSPPRRLRRSSRDRILGGVAGGVGRYLGLDPVIVRIVFVLGLFAGGVGLLAYLVAWVLVPSDAGAPDDAAPVDGRFSIDRDDALRIVGAILLFIAASHLFRGWWFAGEVAFPLALVAAGAWLLFRPGRDGSDGGDDPDEARNPAGVPPSGTGASDGAPVDDDPDPSSRPPVEPAPDTTAGTAPPPSGETTLLAPPPVARRGRAPGFPTSRATTGVIAVVAGVLGIAAANGADISLEAGLAICLALCGAGLVAGAFLGRGRALIFLMVPLVMALSAVSAIDVPFTGGMGERNYEPRVAADLRSEYHLGVGELVLDLRSLDLDAFETDRVEVEATVGMGSLQVLVPRDVRVSGNARTQLGDVEVLGRSSSGTHADRDIEIDGPEGSPELVLDLDVGVGEVLIR